MAGTRRQPIKPLALSALLLGAGLAATYFTLDPARYAFPRCPFFILTGWYCPGCGSQRAIHELLHGRVGRAAGLNLLVVVFAPVLLLSAINSVRNMLTDKDYYLPLFYRPWFCWAVAGLTITFGVLRNLAVPFGSWLAP